jgi:NitT/TauT family transport system permease protein
MLKYIENAPKTASESRSVERDELRWQPEAVRAAARTAVRRVQFPGQLVSVIVSGAALLAIWQTIATLLDYPVWLLPGPLDVVRRFQLALADGTLRQHVIPTLRESVGGFGLALLIGSTLGYGVAHSRRLERWIAPYLTAAQSIPVIAIAPLIFIWFGSSSDIMRNMLVATTVVVFPIFSSAVTGIRSIPRELREVGLVEGATRWQRLRYIELPLALPVWISGIRTSLAYATTGAVVGEFIGSRYGLGALINVARGLFDTPLIFVALACLGLLTLLFYGALVLVERLLLNWHE